jgi:hypothetical protein
VFQAQKRLNFRKPTEKRQQQSVQTGAQSAIKHTTSMHRNQLYIYQTIAAIPVILLTVFDEKSACAGLSRSQAMSQGQIVSEQTGI